MAAKYLYTWLLPLIWVGVTVGSFFNSGDEHGCFALGVYPFCGLLVLAGFAFSSLIEGFLYILPTGVIVIALFGLAMDRLRIHWKLMLIASIMGSVLFFLLLTKDFESFEGLRYKHRSILAPAFFAMNVGLYTGIMFSVVGSVIRKLSCGKHQEGSATP